MVALYERTIRHLKIFAIIMFGARIPLKPFETIGWRAILFILTFDYRVVGEDGASHRTLDSPTFVTRQCKCYTCMRAAFCPPYLVT